MDYIILSGLSRPTLIQGICANDMALQGRDYDHVCIELSVVTSANV